MKKFYSDLTKKIYDTEEEFDNAEKAYLARKEEENLKKTQRAEDAKKVDDAMKNLQKAREDFQKELNAFCKKYGTYHTSLDNHFFDGFDSFFDWFLGF